MNSQLVLGGGTYGVTNADVVITKQSELDKLKPGSYLALLDGREVYTATSVVANFERVQFFVGLSGAKPGTGILGSVPIPRRSVLSIDREGYAASVNQVVEIDLVSIATDAVGDVLINLYDNSYNRTIKNDRINANVYKKAGMTAGQLATAVALKINAHGTAFPTASTFVTATVSTTKVRLTMATPHIDFSMTMDGLAAGIPVAVITPAKISMTDSKDLLRTEKEYSGNLGNGGYVGFADEYFSMPLQTNLGTQYDVFNIKWQGEHDTPQNRQRSATLWMKVAVPTAKGDEFATLLAAIFGTAYDKALGTIEPASEKEFETDGNPTT